MTLITMRPLTFVLIAAALTGCAAKQPHSLLQPPDPWALVRSGFQAYDKGELGVAEREFNRALSARPGFGAALAGKALVEGARKMYERAELLLTKANAEVQTPEEQVFLNLAWLRFYELELHEAALQESERQQIIGNAKISFEAAQRIQPGSEEPSYRMGRVYKAALEFDKATEMFYRVLAGQGSIAANARKEWELLQQIDRLNPQTNIGRRIALSERLTWGEVAALLTQEFRLEDRLASMGLGGQPVFMTPGEYARITVNPARGDPNELSHELNTITHIGLRGLEPRGILDPARPMTRGVFALILEDVLIKLSGDKRLPVRFIGRESRFSDVRPDHYAYNAIIVTTTLKFLRPVKPNEFGLLAPVSGIEALSALQRLRGILRLS